MLSTGLTRGQARTGLAAKAKADRRERQANQQPAPVSQHLPQVGPGVELKPMPFVDQGATGKRGGEDASRPESGLPTGAEGDMLYHNGTDWVVLNKPTGMTLHPVLRYNLSTDVPYWDEPETCA